MEMCTAEKYIWFDNCRYRSKRELLSKAGQNLLALKSIKHKHPLHMPLYFGFLLFQSTWHYYIVCSGS